MSNKDHEMSFDEVWKSLEEQDTTGAYKQAREMADLAREPLEYAYNSGYKVAKAEDAKAEYERPQGAWVDSPDGLPNCCCSLCGAKNVTIWRSFCPNCGAKMTTEAEDAALQSKIDYLMQTMDVSATRALEIIRIITGGMHI